MWGLVWKQHQAHRGCSTETRRWLEIARSTLRGKSKQRTVITFPSLHNCRLGGVDLTPLACLRLSSCQADQGVIQMPMKCVQKPRSTFCVCLQTTLELKEQVGVCVFCLRKTCRFVQGLCPAKSSRRCSARSEQS